MKKNVLLYIHGKNGTAAESEYYKPLFPGWDVVGLDYQTCTPWETGAEIREAAERLKARYENMALLANSIGAFFSMSASVDALLQRAYFISPIVDMERLICDMLNWAGVTEAELREQGVLPTAFGETLFWDYLRYVREHPVKWEVPTEILYGGKDALTSRETMTAFAKTHNARVTVLETGEHWFHTEEQLRFLEQWLRAVRELI